MKERFKTFLLISLVGISLLFAKELWMELPSQVFDLSLRTKETHGVSYLLSDMIMPNKYLLNFDETYHTIFYDDSKHKLWTNSRKVLNSILGSKDIKLVDISEDEFLTYNEKRSISFYFPEKTNTYILAKSLDVEKPNTIVDSIPDVNNIYIYLGNGNSFFVFSNGEKRIAMYDDSIDVAGLKEHLLNIEKSKSYNYYHSMNRSLGVNNNNYISFNMGSSLPEVSVENEIRNLGEEEKRELAQNFIGKSMNYIREIVENNGSTMYIYNKRVLRLNVNGTLEYFHPLEEDVKKRNLYQSLSTAAEFISNNAGVQKGMYLSRVEEIEVDDSVGYNLTFRYRIRGIPVILGNDIVDFVHIEVFNDHVRSYKHFIRKDTNKIIENIPLGRKMLSSFEVIDMNDSFIIDRYIEENNIKLEENEELPIDEVLSSSFIQDITLGYFDPCLKDIGDELIGVWAIRMNNKLYAFDIYDGSLVYERK